MISERKKDYKNIIIKQNLERYDLKKNDYKNMIIKYNRV